MSALLAELGACRRCPRLVAHHDLVRKQHPAYHAAPVGAWGDARGRLIIVGLAPGLHGAARTGKAFVGDASGDFLFAALYRNGFANAPQAARAKLQGVRITNVVKCLPPGNAPSGAEVNNCLPFLQAELARLCPANGRKSRVLLTLGGVAHRALCRAIDLKGAAFRHAGEWQPRPGLHVVSSFHPSRLNVNTGRITGRMLDQVLHRCSELLAD